MCKMSRYFVFVLQNDETKLSKIAFMSHIWNYKIAHFKRYLIENWTHE